MKGMKGKAKKSRSFVRKNFNDKRQYINRTYKKYEKKFKKGFNKPIIKPGIKLTESQANKILKGRPLKVSYKPLKKKLPSSYTPIPRPRRNNQENFNKIAKMKIERR